MLLTVAGVVFAALGLAMAWYGLRPLAVVPRVVRADVRDPGDVAGDPGDVAGAGPFVACRGTAVEGGETVAAPFTGAPCLGFEFAVDERQPFAAGIPWIRAHLDDGVATRRFALRGPGGEVAVDPSPERFALDTASTVVAVGARETPPDRIRRFVDARDGLDPVAGWLAAIPGFGTRRYVERRIDPGETYLIAGRTEREGGRVALAGDLVVTDRSPTRFALARLRTAAVPLVVSAVLVAAGVWAILA